MCGTTIPTNDTGPASDTAAPVASDALTSATRSDAATFTPRAAADSLPTLIRSSTRGNSANPTHANVIGTSAATIGAYDATSSDPISQRTFRNVSVKSARYCTKAMIAESSRCTVTPPRSRTTADDPRRLAAESPPTMASAPSEPAKLAMVTDVRPNSENSRWNVIAAIAPSEAPADTPRVSGEASGLRSSAWNTTPDNASAL